MSFASNLAREPGVFYPYCMDEGDEVLRLSHFTVQSIEEVLLLYWVLPVS